MNGVFWGNFDALCEKAGQQPSQIPSVANVDAVRLLLSGDPKQILFVRDTVLVNCKPQLAELEGEYPSLTVVLVYDSVEMSTVWELLEAFPRISHLLPLASLNSYRCAQDLMAGQSGRFLPGALTDSRRILLCHSAECEAIYSELSTYLAQQSCFAGFSTIAVTSASELLTNAFYNAKRDVQTGKPIFFDRRVKVQLEANEPVEVNFGRDEMYFWLIVRDRFGTLDRKTLIRAISRAARERTPLDNTGGAGLGIHLLFTWATEVNILVEPARSSTIACKFLLTPRNRVFDSEPSAIHLLFS